MLEARSFFEEEILSNMPSQPGPEGNKTPLWEQAKEVKISLGDALVVPIKYEKPQALKIDGGETVRELQKSSYLFIYKDQDQNFQAEWVVEAPMRRKRNGDFVGIISINEWNGKSKRAFGFNENGEIALMQETNSFFRKASMRNTVVCQTIDYYNIGYTPNSPESGIDISYAYSKTICKITIIEGNSTYFEVPDQSEYESWQNRFDGNNRGAPPNDYKNRVDCAGVVDGTTIFSEECQTCIGGTTGIEKCPSDELESIMKVKNDCLTSGQTSILNTTFNQYLYNEGEYWGCLHKFIYQKIASSGIKIGVCLDPTIDDNGAYRPREKNILLPNEFSLSSSTLFGHEFFHVYQDAHYPGGTSQYSHTGNPNLEFEQALFKDIINGLPTSAMGAGASDNLIQDYETWVQSITKNFNINPVQFSDLKGKYYYFLEQFHQNGPYNRRGEINYNLRPDALFSIFTNSNCNFVY